MSVYFATARELGMVKIGYAKDVSRRLSFLQTGCPAKLEMEAVIDGGKDLERSLHEVFRPYRKRGEWFDLAPAVEMAIHFIRSGDEYPESPEAYIAPFIVAHFKQWLQQRVAA